MANIGETSCCLLLFVPSPSAQLRLKSFMITVKDAIKKNIFERSLLTLLTVVCQLAYLHNIHTLKTFFTVFEIDLHCTVAHGHSLSNLSLNLTNWCVLY